MADIYFYQGEGEEEEGGGGFGDTTITTPSQDEGLSPVEKLEKYAESENIFNRQMVARTVLETLRQVLEDKQSQEVERVFRVVELLAMDTEPSVRAELMEQVGVELILRRIIEIYSDVQVPHLAMFCQEQQTLIPSKPEEELSFNLGALVPAHLLPLVVKFLTDTNSQVVTSHLSPLYSVTDV